MDQQILDEAQELLNTSSKLEGEDIVTAYFYVLWLNGDGENLDLPGEYVTLFEIEPDELAEFDLAENRPYYMIEESDAGFISGRNITQREYDKLIEQAENYEDED